MDKNTHERPLVGVRFVYQWILVSFPRIHYNIFFFSFQEFFYNVCINGLLHFIRLYNFYDNCYNTEYCQNYTDYMIQLPDFTTVGELCRGVCANQAG